MFYRWRCLGNLCTFCLLPTYKVLRTKPHTNREKIRISQIKCSIGCEFLVVTPYKTPLNYEIVHAEFLIRILSANVIHFYLSQKSCHKNVCLRCSSNYCEYCDVYRTVKNSSSKTAHEIQKRKVCIALGKFSARNR